MKHFKGGRGWCRKNEGNGDFLKLAKPAVWTISVNEVIAVAR